MQHPPVAIRLARRYAAMGLAHAAKQCLAPKRVAGLATPELLATQIDIALAADRGEDARSLARGLVASQGGASARIRLGLAQSACSDFDAARASLLVALDARDATPRLRAKAYLGLAQLALRTRDRAAAGHVSCAWQALCDDVLALDGVSTSTDSESAKVIASALAILLPRVDRVDEAKASLDQLRKSHPEAAWQMLSDVLTEVGRDTPPLLKDSPQDPAALDAAISAQLDAGGGEPLMKLICRALQVDSSRAAWWRDAAVAVLADTDSPKASAALVDALVSHVGQAELATRLVRAAAEVSRDDVLAGSASHGHRVKNVLGVIAARARSARRAADGEVAIRLAELERELTDLYDGWARYLRSMQPEPLAVEEISVAPWLLEIVQAARGKADAGSATISFTPVEPLPALHGDRRLLAEAIGNLIDNAVEASGGNPTAIEVVVEPCATGICITVVDDGPGMADADLARLMSPGFTTKATGSGLGLTVVYRVVAAHQGRLELRSKPESGTTVVVTLPTDGVGVRWRRAR